MRHALDPSANAVAGLLRAHRWPRGCAVGRYVKLGGLSQVERRLPEDHWLLSRWLEQETLA